MRVATKRELKDHPLKVDLLKLYPAKSYGLSAAQNAAGPKRECRDVATLRQCLSETRYHEKQGPRLLTWLLRRFC